ncbi:MAG: DUF4292 domain-containing protein [Melioribacter sp.]|nr:DUF4292 domain-containing protein [Melioribacter sp.]
MKKSFYYLFGFITMFLLLTACAPQKELEKERLISPDRLIKKLEANRRKIKTLEGNGILFVKNSSFNAKSNFEILLKKPDSLKISFYGPFGIDLAHALITSNDFQFYDVINNNFYKGQIKGDILQHILKVNLPINLIMDALTGSINLSDKLRREPDKFEFEKNLYKVTYIDTVKSVENTFLVKANDLSIITNTIQNFKGEKLLEGKFSNFRLLEDVSIPSQITIEDYKNNQQLKIEYKNIVVNKDVNNLRIEIPNDAKIIEWRETH